VKGALLPLHCRGVWFCGILTHQHVQKSHGCGGWGVGKPLGNPEYWDGEVPRTTGLDPQAFFGGGGGDLGSDLEPEMNPDLRFPQCPPTFLPSGPGDLPYPNSALGDGSKCRNHPQAPPSLRRPLSETDFRTWVSNLKFVT
jgi:hypothetical protein